MHSTPSIPPPRPRAYYQRIGKMGGEAGKGTDASKEKASHAAQMRWSRSAVKLKVVMSRDRLVLSRNVPGLKHALRYYERRQVDGKIRTKKATMLFQDKVISTASGLLPRVTSFLEERAIPYNVTWEEKPAYMQLSCDLKAATSTFNYRQRREITKLLKLPFGGVCDIPAAKRIDVMAAVLQAYPQWGIVIVVEEIEPLVSLGKELAMRLQQKIGILTDRYQRDERVKLMTPHYLSSGVVSPAESQIVIFDRVPKRGMNRKNAAWFNLDPVWRLGFLGTEKRGRERLLDAEMSFGPIVRIAGGAEAEDADADDE